MRCDGFDASYIKAHIKRISVKRGMGKEPTIHEKRSHLQVTMCKSVEDDEYDTMQLLSGFNDD